MNLLWWKKRSKVEVYENTPPKPPEPTPVRGDSQRVPPHDGKRKMLEKRIWQTEEILTRLKGELAALD